MEKPAKQQQQKHLSSNSGFHILVTIKILINISENQFFFISKLGLVSLKESFIWGLN